MDTPQESGVRLRIPERSEPFLGMFEYKTIIFRFEATDQVIGGRERQVFSIHDIYSTREEVHTNTDWLPHDQRPSRSNDLGPAFDGFEALAMNDLRWGVTVTNVINEWLGPWLMRRGYSKGPDSRDWKLQVLGRS